MDDTQAAKIMGLSDVEWHALCSKVRHEITEKLRYAQAFLENHDHYLALINAAKRHVPRYPPYISTNGAFIWPKVHKFSDLAPMLRSLAQQGYKQLAAPEFDKDAGSARYDLGFIRIYASILTKDEGEENDSIACRRVIVGYHDVPKPEPIYKVVCPNSEIEEPLTVESEDEDNNSDAERFQASVGSSD